MRWWLSGRQAARRITRRVGFDDAGYGACRCRILEGSLLRCRVCDLRIGCVAKEAVITAVLSGRIRVRAVLAGGRRVWIYPTGRVGAIAVLRDGSLQSMMQQMPTCRRKPQRHQGTD